MHNKNHKFSLHDIADILSNAYFWIITSSSHKKYLRGKTENSYY